jgi:toxin-antitoxin system PIN domain toxin
LKIADVQILFYAIDPTSAHHDVARRWLEAAINAPEPLALAWSTVHQFLRLGTASAFAGCMRDAEALGWIEAWREAGVEILGDAEVRWELFAELAAASRRSLRNALDDAHLAAIAISRGATLASFDADFEPFVRHGLRWERVRTA